MTRNRRASLIALALAASACGTDPGTGSVEVTTVSEGQDLDSDGYTVHLQGADSQPIAANHTVAFTEVPAGDQEIHLSGVRGNCAVQQAHPRLIRVTAGETFRLQFWWSGTRLSHRTEPGSSSKGLITSWSTFEPTSTSM